MDNSKLPHHIRQQIDRRWAEQFTRSALERECKQLAPQRQASQRPHAPRIPSAASIDSDD